MKLLSKIILLFAFNALYSYNYEFILAPITLEFPKPLLSINGVSEGEQQSFVTFGDFLKTSIIVQPEKQINANLSPITVLGEMLYLFKNTDSTYADMEKLISPDLSDESKEFYSRVWKHPNFRDAVKNLKNYEVTFYFLYKNICILYYKEESKDFSRSLNFSFKQGKWYLAEQSFDSPIVLRYLSAYMGNFKDAESNLHIGPPTLTDLSKLTLDTATVSFYNELATYYKFKLFKDYLNESIKNP